MFEALPLTINGGGGIAWHKYDNLAVCWDLQCVCVGGGGGGGGGAFMDLNYSKHVHVSHKKELKMKN